ncbi:tumor necrosis factor receptor superfamily member 14-like [Protopterus annectens]|uniref:tumor necrosis factor receptor superfamily member 14-like n=1 Tax=Protopterus annectens TaxID=7888 RepID=UPI001CFB9469|nr:tumor necrosis factor receptor superfamily member 14-like [Protopterus annectens]
MAYIWLVILLTVTESWQAANMQATVIGSPQEDKYFYTTDNNTRCKKCPPGTHLVKQCTSLIHDTICVSCEADKYTEMWHSSKTCRPCTTKCSREHNLVEVQKCTNRTARICDCQAGYFCTVKATNTCDICKKNSTQQYPSNVPKEITENKMPVASTSPVESTAEISAIPKEHNTVPTEQFSGQLGVTTIYMVIIPVLAVFIICVLVYSCKKEQSYLKKVFWATFHCWEDIQKPNEDMHMVTVEELGMPLCSEVPGPLVSSGEKYDERPAVHLQHSRPENQDKGMHSVEPANQNQQYQQQASNHEDRPIIGPLHIYSPSTVYVGYINNIQGNSENQSISADPSHTEEFLQYPQQEQSFSTHQTSPVIPLQECGKECHLSNEVAKVEK